MNLKNFYRLQPATPEELLKAFHTIDKERKGYISKECLSKLITEEVNFFTLSLCINYLIANKFKYFLTG